MKNEEEKKQEINKKRKNNNQYSNHQRTAPTFPDYREDENDMLTLSLNPCRPQKPCRTQPPLDLPLQPSSPLPQMPPQPLLMQSLMARNPSPQPLQLSPSHPLNYVTTQQPTPTTSAPLVYHQESSPGPSTSRLSRPRKNPTQVPRGGKSETVPVPFPWATNRRAGVHSLEHLLSRQIFTITGDVQCKRCERQYEMEYDLKEKFVEVGSFIAENKRTLRDRAPSMWMNPVLPTCKFCEQENSVKPIIAEKKKKINWLFLLLGQMLGCCTLEQLKYFCKHTKNHRTGAKDRVLYLSYLAACKQLDPNGPFNR